MSKIAQENEYVKDKFESSQSSSSLNRDAPDGQDVSNNPVQDSTSVEDVPYEVVERNDQIQVPQPAAGQSSFLCFAPLFCCFSLLTLTS